MSGRRIVSIMLVCSVASGVSITSRLTWRAQMIVSLHRAPRPRAATGITARIQHTEKVLHLDDASQVSNEATSEMASQTFQTLTAAYPDPRQKLATEFSEEDVQTLYAQFLEWKRRTGQ